MAVFNNNGYKVKSQISEKALKLISDKLIQQIHLIQQCSNVAEQNKQLNKYNSMIMGIHEYYCIATEIEHCFTPLQHHIDHIIDNCLNTTTKGSIAEKAIARRYGTSDKVRFLNRKPICPIGYVRYRSPKDKDPRICMYTDKGRDRIHDYLQLDKNSMITLHRLARDFTPDESIEYMDNRISVYAMQYGRCAVTGIPLSFEELYCHHIIPLSKGGTDRFDNLVIIHKDIHTLIHAGDAYEILEILSQIGFTKSQLKKFNKLRKAAGYTAI